MFEIQGLVFSKKFDSGNLESIEEFACEIEGGIRNISFKVIPEAINTWERSYFNFNISGLKRGDVVNISVETCLWRMHRFGMRPIYKIGEDGEMRMISLDPITDLPGLTDFGLLRFSYTHNEEDESKVFFSSCYPFSFKRVNSELDMIESMKSSVEDLFFHRDVLCMSQQGRNVEIITISSTSGVINDKFESLSEKSNILYPDTTRKRCNLFDSTKKTVFLIARVHPTEITSSFMMVGLTHFLLHPTDPRSRILRNHFIFKIVVCMNPDGVENGIYRYDANGHDLNRCYEVPTEKDHPSVFSIKHYLYWYHENYGCDLFIDLHGDPHRRDAFIYGNVFPPVDFADEYDKEEMKNLMVTNAMFPKLMGINSQFFKVRSTSFEDSLKENKGTSRAVFGEYFFYDYMKNRKEKKKKKNITYCYTLECNQFTSSEPLNIRKGIIGSNEEFDDDLIFKFLKGDKSYLKSNEIEKENEKKEKEEEENEDIDDEKVYYKKVMEEVDEEIKNKHNNLLANHHKNVHDVYMGAVGNAGPRYDPEIYKSVGKSVCLAILDFFCFKKNPYSFIRSKFLEKKLVDDDEILNFLKEECIKCFNL